MTKQHVIQELERKIKLGQKQVVGKTILHTAPHHDDILLGYFPYLLRNLADNTNHTLYITSGANGVSDAYLAKHLSITLEDVQLLDNATRQELKYNIRESESERKWFQVAGDSVQIENLRAKFYQTSSKMPDNKGDKVYASNIARAMEEDIQRIVDYLYLVQPDIITMLVDPIGIGPTTHYRSQQVLMKAIERYNSSKPIEIIGYRNVWSTFSLEGLPAISADIVEGNNGTEVGKVDMIVPVTQDELDQVESIFQSCFTTQSSTLIFDEQDLELKNFAQQATQIQKNQLQQVIQLLDEQKKDLQKYTGMIFLQKLQ